MRCAGTGAGSSAKAVLSDASQTRPSKTRLENALLQVMSRPHRSGGTGEYRKRDRVVDSSRKVIGPQMNRGGLRRHPAGSPQCFAGLGAGVLAVLDHVHAVDENVLHAGRILVRLRVSSVVDDGFRIEDDHVGKIAFAQPAAALEPQVFRRQSRQLMNGSRQGEKLLFTHVLAEYAG